MLAADLSHFRRFFRARCISERRQSVETVTRRFSRTARSARPLNLLTIIYTGNVFKPTRFRRYVWLARSQEHRSVGNKGSHVTNANASPVIPSAANRYCKAFNRYDRIPQRSVILFPLMKSIGVDRSTSNRNNKSSR